MTHRPRNRSHLPLYEEPKHSWPELLHEEVKSILRTVNVQKNAIKLLISFFVFLAITVPRSSPHPFLSAGWFQGVAAGAAIGLVTAYVAVISTAVTSIQEDVHILARELNIDLGRQRPTVFASTFHELVEHDLGGLVGLIAKHDKSSCFSLEKIAEHLNSTSGVRLPSSWSQYRNCLEAVALTCLTYETVHKKPLRWYSEHGEGIAFLNQFGRIDSLKREGKATRIIVLDGKDFCDMEEDVLNPDHIRKYNAAFQGWRSRFAKGEDVRDALGRMYPSVWDEDFILINGIVKISYDEKTREMVIRQYPPDNEMSRFFRDIQDYEQAFGPASKVRDLTKMAAKMKDPIKASAGKRG